MALTYQGATGASSGVTSVTLPTHAVGDIIVMFVACSDDTSSLTVPSAGGTVPTWTSIAATGTHQMLRYAVATATNHTSGTWTNAYTFSVAVLRGQKSSSPIGGSAIDWSTASSSTVTAPAVTLSNTSGSSQILHFMQGNFGSWSGTPTGYTSRLSANFDGFVSIAYLVLTKDSTTSDGSVAQSLTAAQANRRAASVEILAAPSSGFFAMF
jgi:hypothetical protein